MRSRGAVLILLAAGLMIQGSSAALAQAEGSEPVVAVKNMPAYCHKLAVETFALKPNKVKVKKAVEEGGTSTVSGTADGPQGKKAFNCTFDAEGKFAGMAVESTGGE